MTTPDAYDQLLRLAELFESTGGELRSRARLGERVLQDDEVAPSAELSPDTWRVLEEQLRAATGAGGLPSRGAELDADAVVVRATVRTYRWIDELTTAAHRTMGEVASRALGYLAPEVELGGVVAAAGLIETDALERDDVAAYLGELAAEVPELLEHVHTGGGLVETLQLRALLTSGAPSGDDGRLVALGGLRALGVEAMAPDLGAALRDAAGGLVEGAPASDAPVPAVAGSAPRGLEGLLTSLAAVPGNVRVQTTASHRYIAYLPGPGGRRRGALRLVGGDHAAYAEEVVDAIHRAVADDPAARVLLVGHGQGGATAAEVAASAASDAFVVEHVVTTGSPSSLLTRVPDTVRVLSLEDRGDPVAVLGSLVNATAGNRTTVVFEGPPAAGEDPYVVGGRAADASDHPQLVAELRRLRSQGFLAG